MMKYPRKEGDPPDNPDQRDAAEKLRRYYQRLHGELDTLMAAFATHTGRLFSESSITALMEWSYAQTIAPCPGGEKCRCKPYGITGGSREMPSGDLKQKPASEV